MSILLKTPFKKRFTNILNISTGESVSGIWKLYVRLHLCDRRDFTSMGIPGNVRLFGFTFVTWAWCQ